MVVRSGAFASDIVEPLWVNLDERSASGRQVQRLFLRPADARQYHPVKIVGEDLQGQFAAHRHQPATPRTAEPVVELKGKHQRLDRAGLGPKRDIVLMVP